MNKYSSARVGVVGATGYSGLELLRWLARHPSIELGLAAGSGRAAGPLAVAELAPAWHGRTALTTAAATPKEAGALGLDFLFLATPAEISTEWVEGLRGTPIRIIDLSGAYRFRDDVVYGCPEKNRAAIAAAKLVANPGCYATAANLALAPLVAAGVIEPSDVICDAKSGASGAGKGLREDLHFCELEANCKAYSVYNHRHAPEIAQQAGLDAATFTFTPHLLPTTRGILATCYVRPRPGADLGAVYAAAYGGGRGRFVRLRGARLPEIKDVNHTNFCDLGWAERPGGGQAVIVSALDNLVKGAAGQAIQNFNIMAGFDEATALL